MPIRGQKLYKVWNGDIEIVIFLESGLASRECTIATYLVKDWKTGRQSRVSTNMYQESERDAWELYLRECQDALPYAEKHLKEAQEQLEYTQNEIKRITKRLSNSPEEQELLEKIEMAQGLRP